MSGILNTAIKIARSAGNILLQGYDRPDKVKVFKKQGNECYTNIDKQVDIHIIDAIQKTFPSHSILSEESGFIDGDEYTWIVDPIDGTNNFIRNFPHFSINIYIEKNNMPFACTTFDVIRDELFSAKYGEGAQLNNKKLRVSSHQANTIISTNYDLDAIIYNKYKNNKYTFRKTGSSSLDLAYIASGRMDGCIKTNLKSWDFKAGFLLIKEAGGLCVEKDGNIIAGNPATFEVLKALF